MSFDSGFAIHASASVLMPNERCADFGENSRQRSQRLYDHYELNRHRINDRQCKDAGQARPSNRIYGTNWRNDWPDQCNIILLTDPMVPLSQLFLLWIFPTSILGFGFNGGSISFSIFLAIVEFGGNALLYACTFAAPVALVIAIRRGFRTPEGPTSITGN